MTTLVTRVSVFFALNPDEELTAADIAVKFSVEPNVVRRTLMYSMEKGWINIVKKPNPEQKTKKLLFYSAGPRLLKEIGR